MRYKPFLFLFLTTCLLGSLVSFTNEVKLSRGQPMQLGAYYFDGWTGQTPMHIPRALVDSFPEREPIWGWLTSSPRVVHDQIDAAADAGLSFFSFCWYYPTNNTPNFQNDPKNHALDLYRKADNKSRLKYCLLVANHQGYMIGPKDWSTVSKAWLDLFKDPTYLKANDRPLLIFFSVNTLVSQFGTTAAVRQAFDSLRTAAVAAGLPGVSIAGCISPNPASLKQAQECGVDLLTGYNYHSAGFAPNVTETPIDSMRTASWRLWQKFRESPIPYMPTVTLNWDPRPWANLNKSYRTSPRYKGFSANSVYKDVQLAKQWITENPEKTAKEKIALLYAWNEYGEGAWLTPSRNAPDNPLNGVKRGLK
ncbi:hypothetical protein GCM10027341_35130 [Spirosoma knui]